MPVILVLDANQRSALAVMRSLGRNKQLTIFAADSTTTALAGTSKFCSRYFVCPSPIEEPKPFLNYVSKIIRTFKVDYVFAITEISSQLLLMYPKTLHDAQLPFADYLAVMSLAEKDTLLSFSRKIEVNTPTYELFADNKSVPEDGIGIFPVIIKPTLSRIWLGDRWLNTSVKIARSSDELNAILNQHEWLHSHPFMLQEFIEGHGAGLFALYDRGKPVAFFSHKRLREKPPEGGVSVLSESVEIPPAILEQGKKILDHAKWHGVAMVEFRVTTDGTPYLMEVNTRFWGSLQLAIDAGVDFPYLLYKITCGEEVSPVTDYKTGVRLRWLLGDLDSLYLVLKSPNFTRRQKLKRLADFFTPNFNTRHEVNRLSDFKPAITELKNYVRDLFKS